MYSGVFLGRELHVVVNTNDPDYEHIYSIESYDDTMEEIDLTPSVNKSHGMEVKKYIYLCLSVWIDVWTYFWALLGKFNIQRMT